MTDETAGGRVRRRFLAAMGIPLTLVACTKPGGDATAKPEPTGAHAADTPSASATTVAVIPSAVPSTSASTSPSASTSASAVPSASAAPTTTPSTTAIARSAGPRTWSVGDRNICMATHDTQGGKDPGTSCGLAPGQVVWGGDVARPCGPCSFVFSATTTREQRKKRPDACCFTGSSPSGPGRMLRVEGDIMRSPFATRSDWLRDETLPTLSALDSTARATLAQKWRDDAALEHASVAAFALVALRLMAHGAPADLVAECHRAALDEVQHAAACYALASAYAGEPIGPGPLVLPAGMEIAMTLEAFAVETLLDGCVGETIASFEARHGASVATDPIVAAILTRIADDEERHAELAWRMLAWACRVGGAQVVDAVAAAGTSISARCETTATRRDAVASVIAPCLRSLLSSGWIEERAVNRAADGERRHARDEEDQGERAEHRT